MLKIKSIKEVYGENRFIDKALLVKSFFNTKDDVMLADPESLTKWLKERLKGRKDACGVYCIFNDYRNEVLYVGKSKTVFKRIRQQLIGSKNRKTGLQQYTRLLLGVIQKENEIKEKEYYKMDDEKKKVQIKFFNDVIFAPDNYLKICFTENHVDALVLEETLIEYYKGINQCKYNYY
jgi:hypothetical protein